MLTKAHGKLVEQGAEASALFDQASLCDLERVNGYPATRSSWRRVKGKTACAALESLLTASLGIR